MKYHIQLIAATAVSSLFSAFLIFFYFAYIDLDTYHANKAFWSGDQADWSRFAMVTALLDLIAITFWLWGARTLHRWQTKLETGEVLAQQLPLTARRLALGYPLLFAGMSLLMWLVAGAYFGWLGHQMMMIETAVFERTFVGIGLVGGLTTTTLVFLITDHLWQARLPIFFPEGNFNGLGVPRITVGMRLIVSFLLTGLVPLLIVAATVRNGGLQVLINGNSATQTLADLELTVYFIVGGSLLANLAISLLTTRGLVFPLQHLTKAMNKVSQGDLQTRVPVTANDELGDVSRHFNQTMSQLEQSQQMRDLFGRYVSREVADNVLKNGASLGGESVPATALFADIRDFTGLTESLPPHEVVNILNRYYSRMVDVIVNQGGIVNKFGGDSLLAIFGAPIRQPDHALRAVQAASDMMKALAQFNAEQIALGLRPLTIGIGISSGEMVAGNVGGTTRLEYTVIGDPVNLAARLESLTKEWGAPVLLSEDTKLLIADALDNLKERDSVTVKGKTHPTLVYELVGVTV